MEMNRVVAKVGEKVLIVLPYNSTGSYGSWELPKGLSSSTKEILKQAIDNDLPVTDELSFECSTEDGSKFRITRCFMDEEPTKFHCNTDVKDYENYPGMVFPAYVQMQFVSPMKAQKLLKRFHAFVLSTALQA